MLTSEAGVARRTTLIKNVGLTNPSVNQLSDQLRKIEFAAVGCNFVYDAIHFLYYTSAAVDCSSLLSPVRRIFLQVNQLKTNSFSFLSLFVEKIKIKINVCLGGGGEFLHIYCVVLFKQAFLLPFFVFIEI